MAGARAGVDARELVHVETRAAWRAWLEAHHTTAGGAWLVQWKKATGRARVDYEDAVEEALCFGWVDSTARILDEQRSALLFTPRRPRSGWARTNKERVERLLAQGLMCDAGLRAVAVARENGSWSLLDDAEQLIVPEDLERALRADPQAGAHFAAFSPSARKQLLQWITTARRPETRAARIAKTVRAAAENRRAN